MPPIRRPASGRFCSCSRWRRRRRTSPSTPTPSACCRKGRWGSPTASAWRSTAPRFGVFPGLWALGLTQALPNLAYVAVAGFDLGRPWLYSASLFESFASGLAIAAFMAFLMRICDKDQAATQYALLSALFGLTRFLGGASGYGVEHLGYAGFFTLTFFLALPSYLLLPWVRRWIGNGEGQGQGVGAK